MYLTKYQNLRIVYRLILQIFPERVTPPFEIPQNVPFSLLRVIKAPKKLAYNCFLII